MIWRQAHRFYAPAVALADRHYSRQKPGTPQFMPPGRALVLFAQTATGQAVWGTSWQEPQYVDHRWPDAWVCSIFRNEGAARASVLIRQAVAATLHRFGMAPPHGMITFVKPDAIRRKATPGHCFVIAGFRPCGETASGLTVLQLVPSRMPTADPAREVQLALASIAA